MACMSLDPGAGWYDAFEAATVALSSKLDAGAHATILWGYATLRRHPGAGVLNGHAAAWLAALEAPGADAPPESIEKAMWATASLGHRPHGAWLVRVADVALPRLESFDANGLATLLWAFATLGATPGAEFLSRVADVWLSRLGGGAAGAPGSPPPPPQAVANTLWAFATLAYHPGEPWLEAMAAATRPRLADFPPAALASCMWAYASFAHAPGSGWLPAAADVAGKRLGELEGEGLSQVVWSLATLSHHPGRPWLDAFGRAATSAMAPAKAMAPTALTNMLFGLLVLREHAAAAGGAQRSATAAAWAALAAAADAGGASDAALRMLLTAELLLSAEAPEVAAALPPAAGGAPGGAARRAWRARARAAWGDACRAHASAAAATHLHRDVCRALTALRIKHVPCLLTPLPPPPVAGSMATALASAFPEEEGPLLAIDAALQTRDGGRAALQADGPGAFVRNSRAPAGATLLRDRLYEALGWRVVAVPHFSWPRNNESRTAFLKKVLKGVV
jgi:hypothetical protein